MKLAEALTIRKEMNVKVTMLSTAHLTPKPQRISTALGANVTAEVFQRVHVETVESALRSQDYILNAITALDLAIQTANASTTLQVPEYLLSNSYPETPNQNKVSITLGQLLLLRKKLQIKVRLLTEMTSRPNSGEQVVGISRVPQSGRITRPGEEGGSEDVWNFTYTPFDVIGAVKALRFASDCLREADAAIQQANWAIELNLNLEQVNTIYIPIQPEYAAIPLTVRFN